MIDLNEPIRDIQALTLHVRNLREEAARLERVINWARIVHTENCALQSRLEIISKCRKKED